MSDIVVAEVHHLKRSYGSLIAVNDISFNVYRGEIFGIVGPNGAGKTTTIECMEGIRKPDAGSLRILGEHPFENRYELRQRIGIQFQSSFLQSYIKVWESLDLFSSFYRNHVDPKILLEKLGIAEKRDSFFCKLSGGEKQRLFIALALINDPEFVFLDELTTGLDPQARREVWDIIKLISCQGKTVLLSTHFMEEAQYLCNRIAIMKQGSIVAIDSPEGLIRNFGQQNRIVFKTDKIFNLEIISKLNGVSQIQNVNLQVTVFGQGDRLVNDIVQNLVLNSIQYYDLNIERSSFEDVYLSLVK